MQTTPLPPAPQRAAGREDFSDDADAFAEALTQYQLEQNQQAEEIEDLAERAEAAAGTAVNAPGTSASSTTSLLVSTGTKTLVVQTGKNFVQGQFVTIARTSSPGSWMIGQVVSYTTGTGSLIVNVIVANGSGTYTDWTVALSPPVRFVEATKEQIWAGLSHDVSASPASWAAALATQTIGFTTTLVLDGDTFINADVSDVTSNFTLPNPTNLTQGVTYKVRFKQGGAGGYTWALGMGWDFVAGQVPTLSTAVGAVDELIFTALTATTATASLRKAVA